MRVGFINPPSEFLIDQKVFMSLGILRVATQIKDREDVKFLDLSGEKHYESLIERFIIDNKLEAVCFTAVTPQIEIVYNFCKYIKKNFYGIKIILGGPHVTLMNSSAEIGSDDIKKICNDHLDELLKYVDTIVAGDGEHAIDIALRTNQRIINSEKDKNLFLSKNYDNVAIADRSFLDIGSYHYFIDGKKSTNIISQVGCPYQCEFCSGRGSKTFNRIRKRSVDNILEEIDILYKKYGYEGFMFYDDEINLNNVYFEELLGKLIEYQRENNVQMNFRGYTRSDLLTDKQAKLMYEAGFRWLLVGFESGSDRILKNINKGCSVEDNTRTFEIAKRNNLKIKALMSIGHPGESKETIKETIDWLKKVKPDETDITIVSVYPGSHYFNKANRLNDELLLYKNETTGDLLYIKNIDFLRESNFYKSKSNEYNSYVYTEFLSERDIVEQRLSMEVEIRGLN